jgi:hypothetical protein
MMKSISWKVNLNLQSMMMHTNTQTHEVDPNLRASRTTLIITPILMEQTLLQRGRMAMMRVIIIQAMALSMEMIRMGFRWHQCHVHNKPPPCHATNKLRYLDNAFIVKVDHQMGTICIQEQLYSSVNCLD